MAAQNIAQSALTLITIGQRPACFVTPRKRVDNPVRTMTARAEIFLTGIDAKYNNGTTLH